MQPNEITLANMGQVAKANAAKQDSNGIIAGQMMAGKRV